MYPRAQNKADTKKFTSYNVNNYLNIPQFKKIQDEIIENIKIVGTVLPFKVNNYVMDELIDWDNFKEDPIYNLTFPQKEMLSERNYNLIKNAYDQSYSQEKIQDLSNEIRMTLNPHPAGQKEHNIPKYKGQKLAGIQHKYMETVLFFPSAGQTCHSYCTYCFRWPQFTGIDTLKFAMNESDLLLKYLIEHQEVTDLLLTGGDPMIMNLRVFKSYIDPILENIEKTNIQTIRIGTKVLSYWPYKFTTDKDADDFLNLFEKIVKKGINLALMAHFTYTRELETEVVKNAIIRLRSSGVQIRTQSPILKHINDKPEIWADMWRKQVNLNLIPYYMFIARNTGAQEYFAITLEQAYKTFKAAYQSVSGVCRTVRGPSMSSIAGKIQVLGVSEIKGEKVYVLRFIQARNPDWVDIPFYAKYDPNAIWMNTLKPAFSDKFFFEEEQNMIYHENYFDSEEDNYE